VITRAPVSGARNAAVVRRRYNHPMTTTGQDERAEALAERLMGQTVGILEGAAVWLGTELGFYAALRDGGPATPDELADRAGTQPRYTRESLAPHRE
jgi:hypothetical protein